MAKRELQADDATRSRVVFDSRTSSLDETSLLMRSNLVRLGLALLLLTGGVLLHVTIRGYFLSQDPYRGPALAEVDSYLERSNPPEVLLAGNSHIIFSLGTRNLGDAHSVACLAESYAATRFKLDYLFKRGFPPKKALVLQLDLHSFSPSSLETMEDPTSALFVNQWELARQYGFPLESMNAWLRLDVFPYVGKGTELAGVLKTAGQLKMAGAENFVREFSDENNRELLGTRVADIHLPQGKAWRQDVEVDSLQAIATLCKEHSLALVWIRVPVTREYYSAIAPRVPAREWQALVDALIAQNSNIVLLDYHDIFFGRNDLFFDPNHLNAAGNVEFSAIIRGQLEERGLLTPQSGFLQSTRQDFSQFE